ncbi:hypothetical protein [Streptomyces sp. NPDC007063]|uniref:hypothetical protein n=1 Tax=Streptomyces sp. NPDC007063 TaxID=3364772 RepID=UPI0036A49CC2
MQKDPPERLKKLSVPPAYDNSKGWQHTFQSLPEKLTSIPATVGMKSKSLAYLRTGPTGHVIQSRALGSGRLRWSSKTWNPPVPEETTDEDSDQSTPRLVVAAAGGREYVVAWGHGMEGKDELHNGREIVKLSIFRSDASGDGVTPERTVNVPFEVGRTEKLRVHGGGQGILVTAGSHAASVNVRSGKVKQYEDANELLKQCADSACSASEIPTLTSLGPVVSTSGVEGFGIPGHWFSEEHAPKGRTNGKLLAATDESLFASWEAKGLGDSSKSVFAVHDPETGAIEARVTCSEEAYSDGKDMWGESKSRTPPASFSPDGRYLVAGSVAFDLKEKRGLCLMGDGDRKRILLFSVGDSGTAYGGTAPEDADGEQSTPVTVSLASGSPKALPQGTQIPYVMGPGVGGFITNENEQLSLAIVRER